jgi:hypothetical protein
MKIQMWWGGVISKFFLNLMNLKKSFVSGLGQYMHKAACHLGDVDS